MFSSAKVYRFGEFTLNPAKRSLTREASEVKLRDKDFDTLLYLVENVPKTCSHDEIIDHVWQGTNVENNSIEKAIANIRNVLGDNARDPRFIKTVRAKGYLFVSDMWQTQERGSTDLSLGGKVFQEAQTVAPPRAFWRRYWSPGKAVLAGVFFLSFMLGGLVWWKGERVWSRVNSKTLFSDDFSGMEIDAAKWNMHGRSVTISDGAAHLSVEETDHWGRLDSSYFSFDRNKPITVRSRLKVMYSQNLKDRVYFHGYFGLRAKTSTGDYDESQKASAHIFGVKYSNYDYESNFPTGSSDEQKSEGFFLVRDGADPSRRRDYEQGKVSARIKPVWGEWFEQKIVYDPSSGKMTYFIDDRLQQEFNAGQFMTDLQEDELKIEINPEGWWLYHSIDIDYVEVSQ